VSVYVKHYRYGYEKDKDRMILTVLFCNASARHCAPSSLISLQERYNVVSVCTKKYRCEYEKNEEIMRLTILFRNKSARCCAA
jgi:hypothetical protein